MNNENFHPIQKQPPLAHALHKWDENEHKLSYEYNGVDIISVKLPESEDPGFRHGSDGTMQSIAYTQQIYLTVEKTMWVEIRFSLGAEAINMKPHRAGGNEAVLGQCGNVLLHGVNGLYDIDMDLLIDVNGCEWKWSRNQFSIEDGRKVAYMMVQLGKKPCYINLKMQYYRKHLGYSYYEPWKRKPNKKVITGWCSWEAYRRNISQEKINLITEFMQKELAAYGMEYIQVDDGYQKMPLPYDPKGTMAKGWGTCDETKFPDGHEGIVRGIRERGFIPAIWTNANITNEEFPKYHQEEILWHDGKPLKGEWIDYLYNCSEDTLIKEVTPVFANYEKYGYRYIKIDAIRHLLLDGLHEAVRLGILSNEEAEMRFRSYLEATRRELSEDVYYLASWGEMHEVIGIADACRISMDANPTWAGIRMQLFEMARWFHTQRIMFLNDPDHVCVRTKDEWARSVLSLISLSGGLYMLSDTPDAYTKEKLEIIRKTMPALRTTTAETGYLNTDFPAYAWTKLHGFAVQSHDSPVEMEEVSLEDAYNMAGNYPTMHEKQPFSTLWAFHIEHLEDIWCVMGRFATIPLEMDRIDLSALGLDEKKKYYAFDFWKQEYLGIVTNEIQGRALQLGECQIVALKEVKNYPCFLASSRHVSMDGISVINKKCQEHEFKITITSVPDTKEKYYFIIPSNYSLLDTKVSLGRYSVQVTGELVTIEIQFQEKKTEITLYF